MGRREEWGYTQVVDIDRFTKNPNSKLRVLLWGQGGRLVGCFGFNGPLRQYFSLYQAVSQREGERKEKR